MRTFPEEIAEAFLAFMIPLAVIILIMLVQNYGIVKATFVTLPATAFIPALGLLVLFLRRKAYRHQENLRANDEAFTVTDIGEYAGDFPHLQAASGDKRDLTQR